MKVKQVKLEEITVGDRFREDYGDVESLVESIRDKGLVQPISIDSDYNLLAGGRRLRAATELELKTVPAIIREVEGEIDSREIELIENTLRKDFSWTERAALEKRIYDLRKESDPEWTTRDQAELMGGAKGSTTRRLHLAEMMDAIPELGEKATENEAWKALKRLEEDVVTSSLMAEDDPKFNTIYKSCEKSYKIGDAIAGMKSIKGLRGKIHFIEVDPPYGVELHQRKDRNQDLAKMDNYNEVDGKDYPEFLETVATQCYELMSEHSFMVWWFGPQWYAEVLASLRKVGFKVGDIPAIWTKGSAGQTASPDTMLGSSYEPFFIARKGMPKLRQPGRSNVFHFEPVAPQNKIHPTERPLALMREIMETFCWPKSNVCVPFMGSGVTVRAVYLNQSMGFGWDLDELCKKRFINAVYKDMKEDE
jgi:ParB/RepB/Spo0J family partition protein